MKDCTLRLIVILEHLATHQDRAVTTRELVQQVHTHGLSACERSVQRAIKQLKIMYWIDAVDHGWRLASRLDRFYLRQLREILCRWHESEVETTCA